MQASRRRHARDRQGHSNRGGEGGRHAAHLRHRNAGYRRYEVPAHQRSRLHPGVQQFPIEAVRPESISVSPPMELPTPAIQSINLLD